MNKIIAFSFLMCSALVSFCQTDLKTEFPKLIKEFDNNPAATVQLMDENLRFFGGSGETFSKAQTLEMTKRTAGGKSTTSLSDLKVKQSGKLGVVSGIRNHVTTFSNGMSTSYKDNFTYILEWRNNRWISTDMQHSKIDYQIPGAEAQVQAKAEQMVNQALEDYKKDPVATVKKLASEDFTFINGEGIKWDKNQTVQRVSLKLENAEFSDKKVKTVGDVIIATGISDATWKAGNNTIKHKDAYTYVFKNNGNDLTWLSGHHSRPTNEDRNKALYRELNKAANEGRIKDYGDYFSDTFEIKGFGKGPAAAIANSNSYTKTFPDLQIKILELIADGDLVMAKCEATGTQKGEMNGIPATNKTGKIAHWTINRFNEDGKIVESWNLNDTMSMMQQLGVLK